MACSAIATSADAQDHAANGIQTLRFDVHLDLGWYGALGAGFRADIPIVPEGVIDGVADELALSVGGDLFFWAYSNYYRNDGGVAVSPLAAVQWNFYLNDKWSVFPELGLALLIGDYGFYRRDAYDGVRLFLFFGIGGRYHMNSRNALLLRLSWPAGLQFGITF